MALVVFLVCFGLGPAVSATVSPGSPSTLEVEAPSSVRAGGDFPVTIKVLDEEGNLINNYDELDRNITLKTTGDGELSRSVVNSSQFSNGRVTLNLNYTRAEEIQILAREQGHVAAGQSEPISVRAGQLSEFQVSLPDEARAGKEFSVSLRAFDKFGNPIKNYSNQTNGISIETTGVEKPDPEFIPAKQFDGGELGTMLTYTVAETTRLVVIDRVNGVRTVSDTIHIRPGKLHDFTLSVPDSAEAGTPFRIAIEARDRFGNIVKNYNEIGQGVDLTVPSGGQPEPSYVPPADFDNGVAFVEVTYNRSGPVKLRVQDRRSSVEGESSDIRVQAAAIDHYSLSVPDQVRAGRDFTVTITALDNYGNRIRDYSGLEEPVKLSVRGSTGVQRTVASSAFESGRANVDFQMTETGSNRLEVYNENERDISGLSGLVNVTPGPPGQIAIEAPGDAVAGNNFTALLTLKDDHGNVIRQPGFLGGNVRVSLVNHAEGKEKVLDPSQFINGRNRVVFSHNRAEEVSVFVEYGDYNIRTKSSPVRIRPGEFDQIAVQSPGSVQAGSAFQLNLTLLDRFGNQLQSVPEEFSILKLRSTGSGNIEPRIVPREQIQAPSFSVSLEHYVSETMSVKVLDSRNRQLGISAPVRVTPGSLESFSLQTPDEVSTDEEFTLRIEANDPYKNTVSNLDQRKGFVRLETNSETGLSRTRVQYGEFVNGVAEVPLEYHRTGKLRITARSQGISNQSQIVNVNPGSPAIYDVLIQQEIEAGKPFPAIIKVYDKYGNALNELPSDFHGVKLKTQGQFDVHPYKIGADLFSEGEANVYLAVTGTGELSLSAAPLRKPLRTPDLSRFFLNRQLDTATISVLASRNISGNVSVSNNTASDKIQVSFQPANFPVNQREVNFQGWFLNSITQSQSTFGELPVVSLNIYASESTTFNRQQKANMTQFVLGRETMRTPATLKEIQRLIQNKQYTKAEKLLNKYLQDNPDDQDALQLRLRLQRLREVVGSQ